MLACKAMPVVLRSGEVRRAPALINGNRRVSRATRRLGRGEQCVWRRVSAWWRAHEQRAHYVTRLRPAS